MYEMDKIIDYFVHNVNSGTVSKVSIGLKEPIDFQRDIVEPHNIGDIS